MRLLAATAIVVLSGCATQVSQAPRQPIAPTNTPRPIGVNCQMAQGAYLASLERTVAERRGTAEDVSWARTLMWTVRTQCPGY